MLFFPTRMLRNFATISREAGKVANNMEYWCDTLRHDTEVCPPDWSAVVADVNDCLEKCRNHLETLEAKAWAAASTICPDHSGNYLEALCYWSARETEVNE